MHQTKLCSNCGKPCHYDIGLVLPQTVLCAPCDDRQHTARLAARAAAAAKAEAQQCAEILSEG